MYDVLDMVVSKLLYLFAKFILGNQMCHKDISCEKYFCIGYFGVKAIVSVDWDIEISAGH